MEIASYTSSLGDKLRLIYLSFLVSFLLISCSAESEKEGDLPILEVSLGADMRVLQSAMNYPVDRDMEMIAYSRRHRVKIQVGTEIIEFESGGGNSGTIISSGFVDKKRVDFSRVGSIHTDSGDDLLTFDEAILFAKGLCEKGVLGLATEPMVDRTETILSDIMKEDIYSGFSFSLVELCTIQKEDLFFYIKLNGPKSLKFDEFNQKKFRVNLSYAQTGK